MWRRRSRAVSSRPPRVRANSIVAPPSRRCVHGRDARATEILGHTPKQHSFRLTMGGLGFILATVVICLGAVDGDVNLLTLLFGFCLGSLLINAFYGYRTLTSLSVRRTVPDVAVTGKPFVIRYTVTNRRRWACARGILIEDILGDGAPMPNPEFFVPVLAAGRSVTLAIPVVSPRRGRIAFSFIGASTRLPFYLFSKWVRIEAAGEVVVFPALGRLLTRVNFAQKSTDIPGGSGGRLRGDGEYYGVREYRPGDNPRRIHWRRSAQSGQLMIREMAQAGDNQLWCVVDTYVAPGDAGQARRLELAISAAATVICDALERGVKVGLICNGEPLVVMPPAGGRACRPRLLRELAIRASHHDDDLASHIHRLPWPPRWRSPCLLFGPADGPGLRSAAAALTAGAGSTSVYVPGTGAFDELFQPAEVLGAMASTADTDSGDVPRRVRETRSNHSTTPTQSGAELN